MLLVGGKEADGFFVMFPFFSDEERRRIITATRCSQHKKGETIFAQGDTPQGLVCLSQGKAKLCKRGTVGKEQIVRLVRSWNVLGFRALAAGENYGASAVTIESSIVCTIDRACITELIRSNNTFAMALLQHQSRILGHADCRTVALTQKHIRARLADSLMLLSDVYGMDDDGQTLNVNFSREDLSKLSNMTASNATRTLSDFQNEGLVHLKGRSIALRNIPAIAHISNHG